MSGSSIWTRPQATSTTGRPAQRSREEITAAAVSVAESDGLAAVTMRRVAGELGTGAASLYRHLDTRDDLIDLMIDRAFAQYEPAAISGDPVEDVVVDLMQRLRFTRGHPWLVEALDLRANLSPERIRLIELSLERLAGHPAPGPAKLEALGVLAGMVHTQARHERDGGALDPQLAQAQIELLHRLASDGAHPHLAGTLRVPPRAADESPDDRFARTLRRTLSGLLADS
jgi:AcrR family transcriptional regulator